ncbi:MAG: DNA polymerase IV [Thermodesulfobacteriota bacterium]|nr:DNA polymerase IV [Thermodesulfobacteriota bacterium]
MTRTIMHIDMNAFFAAVEQQSNPALRGSPVAVVGSQQRTIILTSSYEAREYGVKTGMTLYEARQKCPQLQLVKANNRLYTYVSSLVMQIFQDYTPLMEVSSVDEAFLDVSGSLNYYGSVERIAYLIKSRIKARLGLTCSVGIAPNKLLAKLASDLHKPDGLTQVKPDMVSALLENLPIEEICGIGRKTTQKLNQLGIFTCGELGRFPVAKLKRQFGVIGERLILMGRGIDSSPVVSPEQESEVKTVGHSMTLRKDISLREDISRFLLQLAEMVGRRARRYGVSGRTVTLTVRHADFSTYSRQQIQSSPISRSEEIYCVALRILDGLLLTQPIRLLGVRLSNLQYRDCQLPLLLEERLREQLSESLDQVNDRYGEFTVMSGNLLSVKGKGSHVISPAWRPEGIRNVGVQ